MGQTGAAGYGVTRGRRREGGEVVMDRCGATRGRRREGGEVVMDRCDATRGRRREGGEVVMDRCAPDSESDLTWYPLDG